MPGNLESAVSTITPSMWWGAIGSIFVAVACGFAAGFYCARWSNRRASDRARSGVAQLYQSILKTLDAARELCGLIEKYPGTFLTPAQTAHLDDRRVGLLEAISRLVHRHVPPGSAKSEGASPEETVPMPPVPEKINWLLNPTDPATGLPDRAAFESNLTSLLELCRHSDKPGHLLLVRVDKFSGLVSRYGQKNTDLLLKKLAGVVCRAARDEDLVCRCSPDTLSVLVPNLDEESAGRLSRAVRDAARNHHFRIDEAGPEVLLTASYGLTPCHAEETLEPVLNRAFDALSKSQRLGRNQLHIHNGESLVHCAAV